MVTLTKRPIQHLHPSAFLLAAQLLLLILYSIFDGLHEATASTSSTAATSPPSGSGRHGAVEYTDWAIGELLRQAASRPWFDDTVFAIVADHCHSSAGRTEVPVRKYHIPFLVFSPKHVAPGRVDTLASQIDVAPTLLGLLGFSYRSRFFGRDLLRAGEVEPRALLGTYQRLALLESDMLTILSPRRRIDAYRVDLARGREAEAAPDPALVADAIAYYESASFAWRKGLLREDTGAAGA